MKATVIVDNVAHDGLKGEWGLCIYIEKDGKNILLDTGASDLFAKNAVALSKSLADVDFAVLSHAHYDHANGMEKFFNLNSKAKMFICKGAEDNCYFKKWVIRKYIGMPKGVAQKYSDRVEYVSALTEICPGVYLLPHSTKGLEKIGMREDMYLKTATGWIPDDFRHEQSLVIETDGGLVIFNSCSHGGAVNIINEVKAAFPDKKIKALVGGLHLMNHKDEEVRSLAKLIMETGIEKVYTGHCSEDKGCRILKEELGDFVEKFHVGLVMNF